MGIKALIAADVVGAVAAGDYTFEVTDPTLYKTAKIDGMVASDALNLVRHNYAGDGWEMVTDEGKQVQFNHLNRDATPIRVGTYSIEGYVTGPVVLWTEEMT